MIRHLETGGQIWCDEHQDHEGVTYDPRDATCSSCLKIAAAFGAAASMRYAAVEAGAAGDPEIARERDEAIKRLDAIAGELHKWGGFFCTSCLQVRVVDDRKVYAGRLSWCVDCAPDGVK